MEFGNIRLQNAITAKTDLGSHFAFRNRPSRSRPRHSVAWTKWHVDSPISNSHAVTQEQHGTTNQQLAVRAANRERQRLHRQREAQKRAHSIEAQRLASERAERKRRDLHFFGESSTGRDAQTCADELQIHREFLRALGQPDVQPGETLRTVAKRTFEAWLTGPFTCRSYGPPFYVPAFDRTRQQFDPDFGFAIGDVLFDEVWTPPKDSTGDELIDVAALPKLPKLSKAKPKTLEAKIEPAAPPTDQPAPIPQQQPDAIHFMYVPPDAQRFLSGR
jgi:hypothetical protein